MDSKFGFSIIDNGHHRRETRYYVERIENTDSYTYRIYRWREGHWKEVGNGLVEHCKSIDDFANTIAIRLGPSDYEWELMDHNAVTY